MSHIPARAAALVGVGARLPGPEGVDVRGTGMLWEAMVAARPVITLYPPHRWKVMRDRLHPDDRGTDPWPIAPITLPESTDPVAFGLREADVDLLSPSQILVLETAADALADAGIRPSSLAGDSTGIYTATSSPDEALNTFGDRARPRLADLPAGGTGMLSTPLSRWLNAQGPLVTIDTTCSASAYALDAARRDLVEGRVDVAIVVGVNTCDSPVVARAFGDGTALADDGVLAPYDEHAHGYVRGEGAAAVVLVRHDHARRDLRRVYAILEHTRVGADGRSAGVGLPSRAAQRHLIEATLIEAGLEADQLDGVVGHGTGTEAGDAAELHAFARALRVAERERELWLYSIKGLVGHGEGMAGLAGLIAAALMLHHGRIVATAGHHTPAPRLARQEGLRVATATEPLPPAGRPWRVGVHCLGFSGAIGHLILRSALPARRVNPDPVPGAALLPLSGTSPAGVSDQAASVRHALGGVATNRMASHLSHRVDHGPTRTAVLATRRKGLSGALKALAQGRPHSNVIGPHTPTGPAPCLVWTFGGHGAAHPGMGRALYRTDRVFAAHLDQVLETLTAQPLAASWHPIHAPNLGTLSRVQQATFAMQVALARTSGDRYGLYPDVVIGHSLGEAAAAHVAGALSLADAARLVCARSHLLERLVPDHGSGLVAARMEHHVAAEVAQTHQEWGRVVEIAAHNAPHQVVLAAHGGAMEALLDDLRYRGADPQVVAGAPPAHSVAVEQVMDELAVLLRGLYPRPLRAGVDMVSTVTARPMAGTDLGTDYWVAQLRSTVEYASTVAVVGRRGSTLFQEFSPRPVLTLPTVEVRARHALELEAIAAGGTDGPARSAAHAYVHGLDPAWPHPLGLPVDLAPPPWRASPDVSTTAWSEHFTDTTPDRLGAQVEAAVHGIVADLAPTQVLPTDRDRPFAELGLHSMDVLVLRTRLLAGLATPPRDLPEHRPTIASVADALTDLVRAELTPPA